MAKKKTSTPKQTTKPKGLPPVDFGFRFMRLETWWNAFDPIHPAKDDEIYWDEKTHQIFFRRLNVAGHKFEIYFPLPKHLDVIEIEELGRRNGRYVGDREQCEQLRPLLTKTVDEVNNVFLFFDAKLSHEFMGEEYVKLEDAIDKGIVSRGTKVLS